VVNRTSGTGEKQSPVFNVRGDSFRVTTNVRTNTPQTFAFGVGVEREGGGTVTTITRESPGTDSSIVNAGPGNFFLDVITVYTDYAVTVEDCGGAPPIEPDGPQGRIDGPEGVVPRTRAPRIPRTGGPPIVLGALALLGTAVIVGRGVLRR
jgi:hypothetical protein